MAEIVTILLFLGVWYSSLYVYYFEYLKPWLAANDITSYHKETLVALDSVGKIDANSFGWWIVPTLLVVFYIYGQHIESKRWNMVYAGLSFFGMDVLNELINVWITHDSKYAGFWMVKGQSAYVVLIGWNMEIILMFLFAGIAVCKYLPFDKNEKMNILGIIPFPFSNRWIIAFLFAWIGVIVEVFLNYVGALVWCWPQWSFESGIKSLLPIWFFGYFHFTVIAVFVHDIQDHFTRIMFLVTVYGACVALATYLYNLSLL